MPFPTEKGILTNTQMKLDYFLYFLLRYLNSKDNRKLTTAPKAANTIVFKISSERKLGKTLKKVPPAVPTSRRIQVSNATSLVI
ncbi:hypothetical protein [Flavobacterium sp.]|uniref:hypothetical protein n=1 Tax=Flavobacterium sp. TaxID=239 RepID=UPI00375155A4